LQVQMESQLQGQWKASCRCKPTAGARLLQVQVPSCRCKAAAGAMEASCRCNAKPAAGAMESQLQVQANCRPKAAASAKERQLQVQGCCMCKVQKMCKSKCIQSKNDAACEQNILLGQHNTNQHKVAPTTYKARKVHCSVPLPNNAPLVCSSWETYLAVETVPAKL
jgi:hypothetical protein